MSSAEKRSGVDGEDGGIADLRGFGLELGAMESDAMGRLPSDAAGTDDVEVGGVYEAQERGNDEVLVEVDDADTNGDPKIDNGSNDDPSTKNSGHNPGQDFSIRSDIDEGREEASRGTEGHENTETDVLDDYNFYNESDFDVDKHHDEAPLVEHEESEEEESSGDCRSDSSGIALKRNDSVVVRWPIKKFEGAKDSMESENEMNTITTEVLNPDLCKFCRVFFDTWSSVCGCHLCALFLSILSFGLRNYDFSAHEAGDNLPLDQLKPGEDIVLFTDNEYDWTILSTFRTIKDDQREIITRTKIILDHASDSCYIDGKNGQNSCEELRLGTTEESTGIVRAWIRECHLNHSACKQQEDIFVSPTRLIKIDSQEIRLLQGDPEDWSKEASRMATVYGLSSLNIAATAAPDGTIGCLFDRDLRYTEKHKVEVKMDRQKQVYSIADSALYTNNIANAALTKRAWAFQE
ncbi:uncharacterized protein EAF02_006205 [Botrytis sinoallii]|uniref:uncharacterized protein n=1 Tax=Botrytis sinoallii TaxID=1463999 RepID=UPI00190148FD|nr:uncharacterized protein EAF02_006205 [Botrytis sinoallii]KAF7882842.1 hypothetical protein EAF02_006205 [Botrytis sinoallii]